MHNDRAPGAASPAVNNGPLQLYLKYTELIYWSDNSHLCGIRALLSGQSSDLFDLLKSTKQFSP